MPANEGQNEVNEAKTRLIFLFERASKNEVLVWYIHRPLFLEWEIKQSTLIANITNH